jgi:hypothetical protein
MTGYEHNRIIKMMFPNSRYYKSVEGAYRAYGSLLTPVVQWVESKTDGVLLPGAADWITQLDL